MRTIVIGCPGKLAVAELVVAGTKFDDDYTLVSANAIHAWMS